MTAPIPHWLLKDPVSRLAAHWRGDDFSLVDLAGFTTGTYNTPGTQGTFSRTGTAGPKDVNGNSRTVRDVQPAWEMVDWDGDAVRETPALLMGSGDKLFHSFASPPKAMTLYIEFVENGAVAIASAAICYVGNAGNTGARFWIDSTGTYYRVRHDNGSTAVTATLAAAPTSGQRVALRALLNSNGSVQLHQSINGAAESSTSASGSNTLASDWSYPRIYLGTTGDTNPGNTLFVRRRIALGIKTAAQMQVTW